MFGCFERLHIWFEQVTFSGPRLSPNPECDWFFSRISCDSHVCFFVFSLSPLQLSFGSGGSWLGWIGLVRPCPGFRWASWVWFWSSGRKTGGIGRVWQCGWLMWIQWVEAELVSRLWQQHAAIWTLMLNIFEVCSRWIQTLVVSPPQFKEVIVPYSLLMRLTGGTMTSYSLDKISLLCGPEWECCNRMGTVDLYQNADFFTVSVCSTTGVVNQGHISLVSLNAPALQPCH